MFGYQTPIVALEAGVADSVSLGMASLGSRIRVDRESGLISGVSFLSIGDTVGHGFFVDRTMLQQVVEGINQKENGVKCRLTHPDPNGRQDSILTMVGRALNARIQGDKVLGDIRIGQFAAKSPAGDLREYLLSIADEDPTLIGLSIVFAPAAFPTGADGKRLARVQDVLAVDFVGDPAANPNGLLSQPRKGMDMNKHLRKYLEQFHGLAADASNADATALYESLEAGPKSAADSAVKFAVQLDADRVAEQAAGSEAEAENLSAGAGRQRGQSGQDLQQLSRDDVLAMIGEERNSQQLAERRRAEQIQELAAADNNSFLPSDFAQRHIRLGTPVDQVRFAVEELRSTHEAFGGAVRVGGGRDLSRVGLRQAIGDAISLRKQIPLVEFEVTRQDANGDPVALGMPKRDADGNLAYRQPHERAGEFRGLTLLEMSRQYLETLGVPTAGIGRSQVARLVFNRTELSRYMGDVALAHATGDFPAILADSINKTLRTGYSEARATWPVWARSTTAADFKEISRNILGELPMPVEVKEGAEYKYATVGEAKQPYSLVKYGSLFSLTWETLINDDMDAFTVIPQRIGNALRRLEESLSFAQITGNPSMNEDSTTLFHADHSNIGAGNSPYWYVACSPMDIDTIEVCFLEGEEQPFLEEQEGFAVDGRTWKYRHVVAARAIDYRGLVKAGGNLTVSTLGAARKLLRQQTGINSETKLDLTPRFLLVPTSLETDAEQITASLVDPSKSNNTPNPQFIRSLTPISSAYLD